MKSTKTIVLIITLMQLTVANATDYLQMMRDRMNNPNFPIPDDKRLVPPASTKISALLASLDQFNEDGSFKADLPIITDAEKDNASSKFSKHKTYLKELRNIAILYGYNNYFPNTIPPEYNGKLQYKELVYRSLKWYFANRRPPTSVYHETFSYHPYSNNIVGLLEYIGMLLYEDFHADRLTDNSVQTLFNTIIQYCHHVITDNPQSRGPNWSFRYGNCMRHVLFSNDPAEMDTFIAVNNASLDFDPWAQNGTDGIWPDWSLTHHGDMNYWGMYGTSWLGRTLDLARIVKGTPWEYSAEKIQFIENAVINGLQWILYKGNCEITTAPKRLTYWLDRTDSVAAAVIDNLKILVDLYGDKLKDRSRMEYLIANIDPMWTEDHHAYHEVTGHRYFWNTEYQVHRRPNYSIAVRRTSQRVRGPEDSSNSDIKCHLHFGSGYTSILRRGDEYRLSRLGLDYQTLPGTTCERNGIVNAGKAGSTKRGINLFSGGVCEAGFGAGAFEMKLGQYNPDTQAWQLINGASALKGTFFFNNEIVCLGQNIQRILSGTAEIWTTLNQLQRRSEIVYVIDQASPVTIQLDQTVNKLIHVQSQAWFWHDQIGYLITTSHPAKIILMAERRPLNPLLMKDSYKNAITPEDKASGTINMLQLAINHGVTPQNDTYNYAVIPDISVEELKQYQSAPPYTVIKNDANIQAVYNARDHIIQAVFYQPGTFTYTANKSIRVDKKSIIMLRQKDNNLFVSASNPVHRGLTPSFVTSPSPTIGTVYDTPIHITLTGLDISGQTDDHITLSVNLPTARGYEGQTVTQTLNINGSIDLPQPPTITTSTPSILDEDGSTSSTYTISLSVQPSAPVTIIIKADLEQISVSPSVLTFLPNHPPSQTVRITAYDDNGYPPEDATYNTSINHQVITTAPEYLTYMTGDREINTLNVTIRNNDCDGPYRPYDVTGPIPNLPDCHVDILDLIAFASAWLDCSIDNGIGCS